jgi:hypothetical protein
LFHCYHNATFPVFVEFLPQPLVRVCSNFFSFALVFALSSLPVVSL